MSTTSSVAGTGSWWFWSCRLVAKSFLWTFFAEDLPRLQANSTFGWALYRSVKNTILFPKYVAFIQSRRIKDNKILKSLITRQEQPYKKKFKLILLYLFTLLWRHFLILYRILIGIKSFYTRRIDYNRILIMYVLLLYIVLYYIIIY